MVANFGFYLLLLCCLLSIYGSLASIVAAKLRHRQLYLSAKYSAFSVTAVCLLASGVLWNALLSHDYSMYYVAKNSSNDMPTLYLFTAFWSSLEGSHLLWTLLFTIVTSLSLFTSARSNEHIMPYVSAGLQAVLGWMFYLAITASDVFALQLPAFPNGNGMNALLQNVYMAIHPPMLFLGYVSLAIPAAYAVATLCYGEVTEGWTRTVRRWSLFAWSILTVAIMLGGRWAYVELGWGGYWAWDPVENSSLMPWILNTILLHGLLIQGKLGQLKRVTILLCIFAFFMSFFGTFITRSGVISSVHSFAESPIGPNYLAFLAGILIVTGGVFSWKSHYILPSEPGKVWGVSRESAVALGMVFMMATFVIVFIGTLFPIVSEAVTSQRVSIQAPYFNTFAPFLAVAIILVMAVGNLMRFGSAKIPSGKKVMIYSAVIALPLTITFYFLGDLSKTPKLSSLVSQIVGFYLCAWSIGCLTGDIYLSLKALKFDTKLIVKRNLARVGAYLAHVGFIIGLIGLLGNYRALHDEFTIEAGDRVAAFGYELYFQDAGIEIEQVKNATHFVAPIDLMKGDRKVAELRPARSKYPTKPELLHEVSFVGNIWHDIYAVLSDMDKSTGRRITIELYYNPTVKFVWSSVGIMFIGGIIGLFDFFRADKTRDVIAATWESKNA